MLVAEVQKFKVNVGEGKVPILSSLKAKAKGTSGFVKFSFKKITKIAGQTGRKALEWLSFDQTGKDVTIKKHMVKEQTENGKWETCHEEEVKYPAKHRPKGN
jgi:hypothetical protein